jgi:hypothetical protein
LALFAVAVVVGALLIFLALMASRVQRVEATARYTAQAARRL